MKKKAKNWKSEIMSLTTYDTSFKGLKEASYPGWLGGPKKNDSISREVLQKIFNAGIKDKKKKGGEMKGRKYWEKEINLFIKKKYDNEENLIKVKINELDNYYVSLLKKDKLIFKNGNFTKRGMLLDIILTPNVLNQLKYKHILKITKKDILKAYKKTMIFFSMRNL